MPAYTFFAEQIPAVGEVLTPAAEEKSHMRVMRLQPGDSAWFIDGMGTRACARWERVGSALWRVETREFEPRSGERGLLIPLMRGTKLDWIVEKAVEFGVNRLQLFPAKRSEEVRPKLERLGQLIRSAIKQSGALWLPSLEVVGPVESWRLEQPRSPLYFGSLESDAGGLATLSIGSDWVWCAGPEGGWTTEETRHLRQLGGTPVRLAPTILRAETAAIAGVACLTALQMDQPPKK